VVVEEGRYLGQRERVWGRRHHRYLGRDGRRDLDDDEARSEKHPCTRLRPRLDPPRYQRVALVLGTWKYRNGCGLHTPG
jgi:hypothetical protein